MELCSHSLQNILQYKPQVFGRQPGEPMNSIEFYISCHIFKEILTVRNGRFFKICDFGLATVHQHSLDKGDLQYQAPEVGQGVVYNELNPPVIHRDFKPDNILVAKTVRNGRFFKICDFGLATVHQHSLDKGDLQYQAPEVGQGVVYNHKIDVYSRTKSIQTMKL
ncbi:unnamed protein product [Oppiella nova]|uniref:Protein kinase domain-containing protein n=1 Tax=Oppiella nova TaxID=334625 RepID=A0A7R9MHX4_9ACAR|nr:unnamed protein product [Oppiella nova]CAG2177266.1 unnamed protein product [Oppiella nova]